jgi:hypothetical protein
LQHMFIEGKMGKKECTAVYKTHATVTSDAARERYAITSRNNSNGCT